MARKITNHPSGTQLFNALNVSRQTMVTVTVITVTVATVTAIPMVTVVIIRDMVRITEITVIPIRDTMAKILHMAVTIPVMAEMTPDTVIIIQVMVETRDTETHTADEDRFSTFAFILSISLDLNGILTTDD